jgi:DNA-binding transcriptional ArsR family regulator
MYYVYNRIKAIVNDNVDLEIFKIHAGFCSAFSHERRLQILWALEHNEYSVGELAKRIGITPTSVSQHLRIMKEKGALLERKEGKQVFYRIANSKIIDGYKLIREGIIEILRSKSRLVSKKID